MDRANCFYSDLLILVQHHTEDSCCLQYTAHISPKLMSTQIILLPSWHKEKLKIYSCQVTWITQLGNGWAMLKGDTAAGVPIYIKITKSMNREQMKSPRQLNSV